MAQLAQAYIHIRPYDVRPDDSLGRLADSIASSTAHSIYHFDVEVDVFLEAGSLIVRMTVIGGILLGTYNAVANYKDFKAGIAELCRDAKSFAELVHGHFLDEAGVEKEDVYRFERRLKTPGRVNRVLKRLDKLNENIESLHHNQITEELRSLRQELDRIERDLTPEEISILEGLKIGNLPPLNQLPRPLPRSYTLPVAIRPETDLWLEGLPNGDLVFPVQISDDRKAIYHNRIAIPADARPRTKPRTENTDH